MTLTTVQTSRETAAWLFETPALGRDLKRRSVRGAAMTGFGQSVNFVLRFGATAILARLLTPEDYGLLAMTAVIVGFVGLFKDAGLTAATVQRAEISHAQISALFWINVALGCTITLGLVTLSPFVARFYGEPRLVGITCGLALSFLFGGLTVQHQALLRRQMRFFALVVLEIVSLACGIVVGVLMALQGLGYWALVGIVVTTAAANAVGAWIAVPWRPGLPRRGSDVKPLLTFGSDVLGFGVVNYFGRKADSLLIGWHLGPSALGFYDRAYTLLMLPISQLNAPLAAVAIPALSRARSDPAQFTRFFLGAQRLLASVTIPTVSVMAVFADEIVILWLGPAWADVAPLFRLLAVAAAMIAIMNPVGWLMVSLGHTRKFRNIGLVNSLVMVASFAAGLPFGAEGVAVAYSAALAFLMLPTWCFALRGTPISLRALLGCLAPPFLSCVPAVAGGLMIVASTDVSPEARVLAGAVGFGIIYAFVLLVPFGQWVFFRRIADDLRLAGA